VAYRDFINWLSVTAVGRRLVRAYAARLDPILYRLSGGKITSVGPQVIPQLVLTTTGRKSGKQRSVQLGYTEDGDDVLVVASNLGAINHPAWSHNLDVNPNAKIQLGPETKDVVATRLTDSEKAILWPKIADTVPQMKSYVKMTSRNIKVYRLKDA